MFADKKTYHLDDCIPVAFGDFNADTIIDIFCRNTLGNSIRVMLNDDRSPTSKEQTSVTIPYVSKLILFIDFIIVYLEVFSTMH